MNHSPSIPFVDFGGAGALLHFSHPNGYPPGCFRQLAGALAAHYHVLAMKHRPLWPGSQPEELTEWRLVGADVVRFFEEQGLRDVIGVGHSSGAVASVYAAVARPELFRALVLIDPVFLPPAILQVLRHQPEQIFLHPMIEQARNRRNRWASREEAYGRFRQKPVFARFSDETLWDYVNNAVAEDDEGAYLVFPREWEAQYYSTPPVDVWAELPQVTQPVLAIRAAETDTVFPEAWQLWQQLQPQATFVEIANASHLVTMERPLELAHIIHTWLQENGLAG